VTVVTAHQPNYLPGLSVIEKARRADKIVWLDEVQFTKGGFTNRQRMPDGSWLTVPVVHETTHGPINAVKIDYSRRWWEKHERTLRQHYGDAGEQIAGWLTMRPSALIFLNLSTLYTMLGPPGLDLGNHQNWHLQSEIQTDRDAPISTQLARMSYALGGDVYLSGISGRRYLDETPFHELDIEVRYYEHEGPNPCGLELLTERSLA
jgi:hypothetical protein